MSLNSDSFSRFIHSKQSMHVCFQQYSSLNTQYSWTLANKHYIHKADRLTHAVSHTQDVAWRFKRCHKNEWQSHEEVPAWITHNFCRPQLHILTSWWQVWGICVNPANQRIHPNMKLPTWQGKATEESIKTILSDAVFAQRWQRVVQWKSLTREKSREV